MTALYLLFHRTYMTKILLAFVTVMLMASAQAETVAGIEVGSKGIKGIVVDFDEPDKAGEQTYKIIFREEIKADIIDGAVDQMLSEKKIAEAAEAVRVLIGRMKKYDPQHMAVVGSTSFDNYRNYVAFQDAVLSKTGKNVRQIIVAEELFYALKASVRTRLLNRSLLIDIGSGNTKIGYATPMSSVGFEATRIELGSKSLAVKAQNLASAANSGLTYEKALAQIVKNELIPSLRDAIKKQPGIASPQRRVYAEGGAVWAVASYAQPENIDKPFSYLTLRDVDSVIGRFDRNELAVGTKSELADETFVKILDNFDRAQLLAGASIFRAFLGEINMSQRQVAFNRNSGWIIGYLYAECLVEKTCEK